MRLIDSDELKEHLFVVVDYDKAIDDGIAKTDGEVFAFRCGWNDALKSVVQFAPTVDAVEVVRCKDCKWYKESKNPEMRPMRFCYRLKNDSGVPVGYNWDDNDFCSYGKRGEDKITVAYYGDNKLYEINEVKDAID